MSISFQAQSESFPLSGTFRISRGAKTTSDVVTVTATVDGAVGRGECVPYPRYGETIASVLDQIQTAIRQPSKLTDRSALQSLLPPGAARNALDCALWDLESKQSGRPVWELAGIAQPQSITTAFTLSLDKPDVMRTAAAAAAARPLLKLKLAGDGLDLERVAAVRAAAPDSDLIVDANEACSADSLEAFCNEMHKLQVKMIEQPLPAGEDAILETIASPVPLCADESCHDRQSLPSLINRYQFVNIKLDKSGGLTEALALKDMAIAQGFRIMVGCMVGTSLSMAPAALLAGNCEIVDLDGPLYLQQDRDPGLNYHGSIIDPVNRSLWG